MADPIVVPRANHPISRQNIDPDALKVLYRLHQFNHLAYLVGGSVRDLLIGRTPKDFDIGTSAHPYQVKRLFRNCWIIGRRFRLAHVKFGPKVIEVATFRRQVPAGTEEEPATPSPPDHIQWRGAPPPRWSAQSSSALLPAELDRLIYHDNTFGTPEEDAFRRDFTLNALFYDIETRSVIDYVGGLDDIRARLIRCIGQPDDRFREDPVRMLRAIALAARLDFRIDAPILESIARYHGELARSAPARLIEEIYKVLRAGAAERTFRGLVETGLLAAVAPEVPGRISPSFWRSLSALDRYRTRVKPVPEAAPNGAAGVAAAPGIPNAVLLGTLLIPLDLLEPQHTRTKEIGARFGILPLARRDVEELRLLLSLQRHLRDVNAPLRAKRSLMRRHAFQTALTWLDIHGTMPELVETWRSLQAEIQTTPAGATGMAEELPLRRRRRRRRRRNRAAGPGL